MGTILGAYIARAGGQIDLINRNKAHIEALKDDGARVVGTVDFTQAVSALLPEEMTGKYDIIILLTKQQHNHEVCTFLKDYMSEDGVLVTLQNGLPEDGIAEVLGEDRVLGCIVAWGATMLGPGLCELTSSPDSLTFSLGRVGTKPHKYMADVKDLLELMGPVTIKHNFIGMRWSKLLINSAFSGMSTVLGCTFGEAAKNRRSRRLVLDLINECIKVCETANIKIEPVQGKDAVKLLGYKNPLKRAFAMAILPFAIRKHALLKASMLQDIEHGKKTEVESLNGAVANFGRKFNVPTPLNSKVTALIHDIEDGKLKPSFDNLKYFD
jgi:2-dehydropantoate 2-reductase